MSVEIQDDVIIDLYNTATKHMSDDEVAKFAKEFFSLLDNQGADLEQLADISVDEFSFQENCKDYLAEQEELNDSYYDYDDEEEEEL